MFKVSNNNKILQILSIHDFILVKQYLIFSREGIACIIENRFGL